MDLAFLIPRIHVAYINAVFCLYNGKQPKGTLYIGVTNNLNRRIYEHKNGLIDGFTKKYKIKLLVYFEMYDYISNAIQREKTLKHWKRQWKIKAIEDLNPHWKDLYETL